MKFEKHNANRTLNPNKNISAPATRDDGVKLKSIRPCHLV